MMKFNFGWKAGYSSEITTYRMQSKKDARRGAGSHQHKKVMEQKAPMSNKLLTALRQYQLPKDTQQRTATRCLLYALADRADDERFNCFPSVETLAYESHMSIRGVHRSLKQLVALGLISIRRRWNTSSVYTLNLALILGQPTKPASTCIKMSKRHEQMWNTLQIYCKRNNLHLPSTPSQQDLVSMDFALEFHEHLSIQPYLITFCHFIRQELGPATNIMNPLVRFQLAYENHHDAIKRFDERWPYFGDSE